ncbi:glycosyltransferase [uncultured Microbulbifer sp.]|uniref:glycosyltransferase n=1 Tax=uncultured Microbulbifer sp. TaxID=348147 RepID=UPI002619E476|nr:glycosyltransferase [uncultured Microbulbifer sp.]
MNIRFSIIIPCYNNADLLRNVLQGYSTQTTPKESYEVILIDNNSSDPNIISCYNEYKNKVNITLVFRPVLANPFALNSARNLGLRIAKNNWCIFTDSDCIPSPSYLMQISTTISNKGKYICMAGLREFIHSKDVDITKIDTSNSHLSNCPRIKSPSNYGLIRDRRLGKIELLPNTEQPWGHFYGCNMVFKKQDIINAGLFDEQYDGTWGYDDIDLAYRVIHTLGVEPVFIKEAVVYHQDKVCSDTSASEIKNRIEKINNPNYKYICKKIPGYYEFSLREFKRFGLSEFQSLPK